MAKLNFRVDSKLDEALRSEAREKGYKNFSAYIVDLLENRDSKKISNKSDSDADQSKVIGKGVIVKSFITKADKVELDKIAKLERVTISFLLRRQIKILINNTAYFSDEESKLLRDATFQLKAIGRNLNQHITQINSGKVTSSSVSVKYIDSMKRYIDEQAKAVRTIISKNTDRTNG